MRRFTRPRLLLLLLLPALFALSACAQDAPQDTLDPQGPVADKIDGLSDPVFLVAGIVFVIVEVGALLVIWRFRSRKTDDETTLPGQNHGNFKLEIGWTIVPALILVGVGIPTFLTTLELAEAEDDAMEIDVYGQQWWWSYDYDVDEDGEVDFSTANDLVIPVGRDIELTIRSRDVIHSWWAPKLTGKRDAVPGRAHPLIFSADEPGTYIGQCTEFCGLSHAYMHIRVVALEQPDFDAWLESQQADAEMPTEAAAARGAENFVTKCSSCHLARGINDEEYAQNLEENGVGLVAGYAPDLTHLMTRGAFAGALFDLWDDADGDDIVEVDEIGGRLNVADLEAWLRDPQAEKPMAPDQQRGMPDLELTEAEINDLVAFLETLD